MSATNMTVTINGGVFTSGGAPLQGSQNFSTFIAFGDSNIDTGYFFTHPNSNNTTRQQQYQQAVAAGSGLATDPGHYMNTTLFANAYGLTAIPDGQAGGTNYAANGATVTGNQKNPLAPSVVQQITNYLASHQNHIDPTALIYISGGGNSAAVAQDAFASLADQRAYMVSEAHALSAAIASLSAAGARNFVIQDLSGGASLSTTFNATLWEDLEAANIPFLVADTVNLAKIITNNPSTFGISDVIKPPDGPFTAQSPYNVANGGSSINPNGTEGWAKYATQVVSPTAPDTYLWADGEHLSAAGQRIEASYIVNAVENAQPVVAQILRATQQIAGQSNVTLSELSFQWQREVDGSNAWVNIPGATANLYTVTANDVGSHLRVIASFHRTGAEASSAVSPSTPTVIAAEATPTRLTFYDTIESNNFVGSSNIDDAIYFNRHTAFTITGSAASLTVTGPNTGTDHLTNVERLQFPDGVVAFDIQGNAGNAYRLYQAAFDRTPDQPGLSFWTHQLDLGVDIQVVAAGFVNSSEFRSVYGTNPTNAHIVDLMYQNVLGRAGEPAGINFWVGQLDHGLAVGALLQGFATSSENHGIVDPTLVQGILLDRSAFLL